MGKKYNFKFDSVTIHKFKLSKTQQKSYNKRTRKFKIDSSKCYSICSNSKGKFKKWEKENCSEVKDKIIEKYNSTHPDYSWAKTSKVENCTIAYSDANKDSTLYKSVQCQYFPSIVSNKLNSIREKIDYTKFNYSQNDCFMKYNNAEIKGWFYIDCNLALLDSIALKSIQKEFIDLGYTNIKTSGYIDNLTILAYEAYFKKLNNKKDHELRDYQLKLKNLGYDIDITGILDEKTKIAQDQYKKDLKKKK
ncbi:hypothetical protein [Urechidicola croceus]|uniref:Uncharacterized protein n=1 Tax=Urechidicola croceus TaxID=1850246 RepID=A0A1D8P3Q5_9FLAO|nr:hypothetical protein [Urechidicola croceus]AOW19218.1 hypothetical protein LPB138_00295 [Urechidicola croceus]